MGKFVHNSARNTLKIDRHGKAKVLSPEEIQLLFNEGLTTLRDRCLFAICLYTACRINEACTLRRIDVYNKKRNVRPELILRKGNTKGKLATRCIPIGEDLRALLTEYNPPVSQEFLFPGRWGKNYINPMSASRILREAFERIDIEGASTHSLRRTALTTMSNNGIPLRIIQEVSGHRSLEILEQYLAVKDEQVRGAIASLSHISYVKKSAKLHGLIQDMWSEAEHNKNPLCQWILAFDCPSQVWLALEAILVLKQWNKQPPKNGFQLYQSEQLILNRLREYKGIKANLLYSNNEDENLLFLDEAFSFTLIRLLEAGVELAQYYDYLQARTGQANLLRKGEKGKRSNRGFGTS